MDELIDSLLEHKTYRKPIKIEEEKQNEESSLNDKQIDQVDAVLPDFIV